MVFSAAGTREEYWSRVMDEADAFMEEAARGMNARGWILRVEDGYRTLGMQKLGLGKSIFSAVLKSVVREVGGGRPPARLMRRRFGPLIALSPRVGTHMSASALDVSVLSRDTGEEVCRGGPYLEMSELTPMGSPFVTPKAAENRREITSLMEEHGFAAYPFEFWHYSGGDAYFNIINKTGLPAKYGAVHLAEDGSVSPFENPLEPIVSEEVIERLIGEVFECESKKGG